ncbi:MAG: hypothetical protein ACO3C1_11490 [Ilumatobacteraceae bacterium]
MSNDPGLFGRIQGRIDEAAEADGADAAPAFSAADLLDLDDAERPLVQLVMKAQPIDAPAAAERLGSTVHELGPVIDRLVARGALVRADDGLRVGTWKARRRTPGGLWARLGDL